MKTIPIGSLYLLLQMLTYVDLDSKKKGYAFELDNVLYPEKDYLLQVYYLFANFIEFTETIPTAEELTSFFKTAYELHGSKKLFDRAQDAFGIQEKYRSNFEKLHLTAKLPLKLLMFDQMLSLLQQIVVDRKQLFLVAHGNPVEQLNKIRQIEWNGLEKYLRVYFAEEIKVETNKDVLEYILEKHDLKRKDVLMVGATKKDKDIATSNGVDYIKVDQFLDSTV